MSLTGTQQAHKRQILDAAFLLGSAKDTKPNVVRRDSEIPPATEGRLHGTSEVQKDSVSTPCKPLSVQAGRNWYTLSCRVSAILKDLNLIDASL